jgi:hypothetical protein
MVGLEPPTKEPRPEVMKGPEKVGVEVATEATPFPPVVL